MATGTDTLKKNLASAKTDAGAAVRPNLFMLALIATIPLQNIYLAKLPTLGPGLNYLNVMTLLALLTWFLRKDLSPYTPSAIGKLLGMFIFVYIISFFVATRTLGSTPDGLVNVLKDMIIAMLFYYIVLNSVRDKQGIIYVIIATLFPLPYMFHVFKTQLGSVLRWHYDHDFRLVSGTFMELGSNEIAAFYATYTLILLAIVLMVQKNLKWRLIVAGLAVLNIYCVVYSFSRGAYVSLVVGCVLLAWHRSRKLTLIGLISVFVLSGTLLAFLPVAVQERVDSIFVEQPEDRDASAQSRLDLWALAVEEWKKSPVIGIGFQTFKRVGPTNKDTHNYFVKVLTEQGAVGITILALLLFTAFRVSRRLFFEAEDSLYRALGAGMVACIVALMIGNMFGDRFTHYPLITYFWVYLALVQRALILTREGRADAPVPVSKEDRHEAPAPP